MQLPPIVAPQAQALPAAVEHLAADRGMTPVQSLDHIARKTAETAGFREVVSRLERGDPSVLLHGLPTTLTAFLLSHIQGSVPRPLVVVAGSYSSSQAVK